MLHRQGVCVPTPEAALVLRGRVLAVVCARLEVLDWKQLMNKRGLFPKPCTRGSVT